mgnify:CR=1 FL=1
MWLYSKGKRKGETLELTATPLSEIPIKKCGDREMASIVLLVDSIISAKNRERILLPWRIKSTSSSIISMA